MTGPLTPALVLEEAAKLLEKKGQDYQNPSSSVRQADYFPRGADSIIDILNNKMLRARSICETARANPSYAPNNESLYDSAIDMVNYAAILAAWLTGGVDGQDMNGRDFLNRKKYEKETGQGEEAET